MTSDGLSEGVFLLVIAVAILLGVRAARRPGIGGFLLCGMATGASYLVRPEGLIVAIGVGSVIVLAWLNRHWTRADALGRLTALAVGVALVGAPYMVLIGKLSNKPTEKHLLQPGEEQAPIWLKQPGAKAPVASGSLFAAWWDPARDEGKNRIVWAVGAVWSEMIKSLYYAVGAFALFGLIASRRRIVAPDPGLLVLVAIGLLNILLLLYLATRIGYVSERHTVLFVMLSCVFAAAAFEPLGHFVESLPGLRRLVIWPSAAPGGFLVAIVVAALPVTLQTMHPHREGHKHAGRWLANTMSEGDWLKDPLAWGEWYAGRTLYNPPVYHGRPETIWVIVENGKGSPHSRLPQWEDALRLKNAGHLVFRWPENAAPEGAGRRSLQGEVRRRVPDSGAATTQTEHRAAAAGRRAAGGRSVSDSFLRRVFPRDVHHVAGLHEAIRDALPPRGRILDLGCGANSDLEAYRLSRARGLGYRFPGTPGTATSGVVPVASR